jgi:hypothetical protein
MAYRVYIGCLLFALIISMIVIWQLVLNRGSATESPDTQTGRRVDAHVHPKVSPTPTPESHHKTKNDTRSIIHARSPQISLSTTSRTTLLPTASAASNHISDASIHSFDSLNCSSDLDATAVIKHAVVARFDTSSSENYVHTPWPSTAIGLIIGLVVIKVIVITAVVVLCFRRRQAKKQVQKAAMIGLQMNKHELK